MLYQWNACMMYNTKHYAEMQTQIARCPIYNAEYKAEADPWSHRYNTGIGYLTSCIW